ncbi:Rib/alpha-like domain-containing protein [Limosilactobacillus albertensis]|uniref:Rib domain-containing protein n=1 Tax=Limosilactobacillus albertensis TaxID=2759752 RepID=A0A839H7I8_9LACO|nr:Rib/alpha-like domain-containing protein [Limosilactobacillus albertensis]MBB1122508.1 hypothetical protein [Limosilactobacillus albertensis]MCD7121470.1 hypothetical protein [Limosilactobacillus albertensis]
MQNVFLKLTITQRFIFFIQDTHTLIQKIIDNIFWGNYEIQRFFYKIIFTTKREAHYYFYQSNLLSLSNFFNKQKKHIAYNLLNTIYIRNAYKYSKHNNLLIIDNNERINNFLKRNTLATEYTHKGQLLIKEDFFYQQIKQLSNGVKYFWAFKNKVKLDTYLIRTHYEIIRINYSDRIEDALNSQSLVINYSDAKNYTAIGRTIKANEGNVPEASLGILNKDSLPKNTSFSWLSVTKVAEDVKIPGRHTEQIIIRFPDSSEQVVKVPLYIPTPTAINAITSVGIIPPPHHIIKNHSNMPKGTMYIWKKKPDIKKIGNSEGIIELIYPDQTLFDISVTVLVKEKANVNHEKKQIEINSRELTKILQKTSKIKNFFNKVSKLYAKK